MGNVDVGDGWAPQVDVFNSLARKEKEKLCINRGEWT